jgi:ribosomal protein L11 methylase PrmA
LMSERKRIIRQLKPGGALVLAGILKREFNLIVRSYGEVGLRLVAGKCEKEWRSGTFKR